MNGAESLLTSLIDAGVEVCFANPGTSEMQLVAAIDKIPGMHPILCLFEGVVTGAADGYGRMADKPAVTLLHLAPGFSNGMANLHNAKRAHTPIVNIIGNHATHHLPLDSPLTADVQGYAALTSDWVRSNGSVQSLGLDGVEAVAASMTGRSANLIVPADHAWTDGAEPAKPLPVPAPEKVADETIGKIAVALRSGEACCLFLGGKALRMEGLLAAKRIEAATGAKLICETFPARLQRGRGRPSVDRLEYFGEMAQERLKGFKHLITVGAKPPVSFFAYPGKPSTLWSETCAIHELANQQNDQILALEALADYLGAPEVAVDEKPPVPSLPDGPMTADAVNAVVAQMLPENAIVSDESCTSMVMSYGFFDNAAPHDWLTLTGGAIGQGMPVAMGAAVACPDRKVVNLQADGSAMYTNQALWSMARENLDVCVVIYNNSSYAILNYELMRVGVDEPGERALSMLDLSKPDIHWADMAEAMGVKASRVTTTDDFKARFKEAMASKGPRLIEVIL